MASDLIILDSSILIDYFRKAKKEKSAFVKLATKYPNFAISVITRFEIYVGSSTEHSVFWDQFFSDVKVLPLTSECIDAAIDIERNLRKRNKLISFPTY